MIANLHRNKYIMSVSEIWSIMLFKDSIVQYLHMVKQALGKPSQWKAATKSIYRALYPEPLSRFLNLFKKSYQMRNS